jgi:hypothetical protein
MGYSAKVELALRIHGELFDVCQTGPDFVILREARVLPAVPAELLVTVDGECDLYPIVLYGSDGSSSRIRYW